MVRDIALWVPGTDRADELLASITAQAGELLVHKRLFDIFEKEGRTSYAFRLVFQASDRTLTDVEVNAIMERITKTFVEEQGFEVR
jgi:phenylalanyl-tRNA synthetase beta chain